MKHALELVQDTWYVVVVDVDTSVEVLNNRAVTALIKKNGPAPPNKLVVYANILKSNELCVRVKKRNFLSLQAVPLPLKYRNIAQIVIPAYGLIEKYKGPLVLVVTSCNAHRNGL